VAGLSLNISRLTAKVSSDLSYTETELNNTMKKQSQVFLRSLEEADLERTHLWHNDPELYSSLINPFRFVSKTAELEWLRRKAGYSGSEVNCAICLRTNGEHIGNISLAEIDWVSRKAELGIFIGSSAHHGKGYGKEAVRQLLSYAFFDLNLNRVSLEVLADNAAAIKSYEKCGFTVEGRLKGHVFKKGAYKDVLLMGICRHEFKQEQ
jgi:RimJ/RimL family protein N-acetyltransferase